MSQITLLFSYRITRNAAGKYLLRGWISTATGIAPEVFVYKEESDADAFPQELPTVFSHVASVAEMQNFPVEVSNSSSYPYFRRSWVQWEFVSLSILHEKLELMRPMLLQLSADGVRIADVAFEELPA